MKKKKFKKEITTMSKTTLDKAESLVEPETTTYSVYHYRDWIRNKHARSGYEPGVHRFTVWASDDPQVADQKRESGSLWDGAVWSGSAPTDDADEMAALEARAERAATTHRVSHAISTHGHDLLLRRFWPDANHTTDLVTDADPELVTRALSRKDARELAVRWGKQMPKTTRPDTSAVVQALAWAYDNERRHDTIAAAVADGPAAIAFARRALQAHRDGLSTEDFVKAEFPEAEHERLVREWLNAEKRAWDDWLKAEDRWHRSWFDAEKDWYESWLRAERGWYREWLNAEKDWYRTWLDAERSYRDEAGLCRECGTPAAGRSRWGSGLRCGAHGPLAD